MTIEIIQDRLNDYHCANALEEENAVKEIIQEICLSGLARTEFFRRVLFQGGTCLRILHKLPRFSEDLDFILSRPDKNFSLFSYLPKVVEELSAFGFNFEIQDRSQVNDPIHKAFLKEDSWGSLLTFEYYAPRQKQPKKLRIKVEVDTCPPAGSLEEEKVLDFPFPFTIRSQDLSSLFAGKCHALLCRSFTKGRDWYDFLWYVRKSVSPNLVFLKNALFQLGPWKGEELHVDGHWLRQELSRQIEEIRWDQVRKDIERFVRPHELPSLSLWSKDFFQSQIGKAEFVAN